LRQLLLVEAQLEVCAVPVSLLLALVVVVVVELVLVEVLVLVESVWRRGCV